MNDWEKQLRRTKIRGPFYHATPAQNVRSILKRGLIRLEDKGEGPGGASVLNVSSSLGGLREGFLSEMCEGPGVRKWAIFQVDVWGLPVWDVGDPDFEAFIVSDVSPDRLKLVGYYDAKKEIFEEV